MRVVRLTVVTCAVIFLPPLPFVPAEGMASPQCQRATGNRFTIQIDEVWQNVPIDPDKFTPPAEAR